MRMFHTWWSSTARWQQAARAGDPFLKYQSASSSLVWYNNLHSRHIQYQQIDSFLNCMFYQLLCVQHSCSLTQSWGSILPSIVEMRDQNSRGCLLLFSNRNLGSFLCIGDRNPIHPQPLRSCGPLQE